MEQKGKDSLGAILLSLMLCTYAILVVLSLTTPNDQLTAGYTNVEDQDNIIIAPYELSKKEQELVSLTRGRALSWIFNLHVPGQYKRLRCWAEVYQDRVLINEARVWDTFEDNNTESRDLQLGLRIVDSDSGVFPKYKEVAITDTKAGDYCPLDKALHIKPDEERSC